MSRVYDSAAIAEAFRIVSDSSWNPETVGDLLPESWVKNRAQAYDILVNVKRNIASYSVRQCHNFKKIVSEIEKTDEVTLLRNMAHYAYRADWTVKLSYALFHLYEITLQVEYLLDMAEVRLNMPQPLPGCIIKEIDSIDLLLERLRKECDSPSADTARTEVIDDYGTRLFERRNFLNAMLNPQSSRSNDVASPIGGFDVGEQLDDASLMPQPLLQADRFRYDPYNLNESQQFSRSNDVASPIGGFDVGEQLDDASLMPQPPLPVERFRYDPYNLNKSQLFFSVPRKLPEATTSSDDTELSFQGV